ncbi:MAG: carotenoid oxygenase family protein [Deltaproteobacteria bacterium]|nr:carotenoid oxygenase family protein [Deltaproteobacteria bacterium]
MTELRDGEIPETRRALGRAFQTLGREHGFEPLTTEGTIPKELRGTFYRNGPALYELFGRPYVHYFDGDGAISAFRFRDGRVEGAVRVTETPDLTEERRAGRALYGSGFTKGPLWRKRVFARAKNPTNIHVLAIGRKLWAMPEMGVPIAIDPETLSTRGPDPFGGVLRQMTNAHCRTDPESGVTYTSGLSMEMSMTTSLHVYAFDASGAARHLTSVPLGGFVVMLHDFALTKRWLVFVAHPVRVRLLPVIFGLSAPAEPMQWRPELGSEVLLVERAPPHRVTRFRMDTFFHFHFANAFDRDDGTVVTDVCAYDTMDAPEVMNVIDARSGRAWVRGAKSRLDRITLDPARMKGDRETIASEVVDFPTTAARAQTHDYRYVYPMLTREHRDLVAKLDVQTGDVEVGDLGRWRCPGEASFVPRDGATGEDDGWLLTLAYDAERHRSGVAILDAARIGEGAIGWAWMEQHVPFPIHGCFVPG